MKRFKYLTLAALVGLWACDSGTSTPETPVVTGTISGTVTIEGTGAAGVTVTLSSGTTATTDASGNYTFSGVNAGAYTVSISGYASDATFDATAKAATITTSGQVATVNFAGSYIKTSSIVGVVTGGGTALSGVKVSIGSSTATTGTNGDYSFSGLRKGSYTVTISGYDATMYTFSSTSTAVTLGVGESKVVSFSGSLVTTAKISGRMFLDENNKDDTYTAGLEDNLSVANVAITLEGNGVSAIPQQTVNTAADGTFSFSNLAAGNYRLTIDAASAAIPGNVAFGGTSTSVVVAVASGSSATVNWPFDITKQAVRTYAFLGTDATGANLPGPGIKALGGIKLDLYDTQADAAAHVASAGAVTTGRLGTGTTASDGSLTFRYTRSSDKSPAGPADNIVFAVAQAGTGVPPANVGINGETIIEIKFNAKDSLTMAPDTFDFLNGGVKLKFAAKEIDGDSLPGWNYRVFVNDTTAATLAFGGLDAHGNIVISDVAAPAALPVTYYMDLAGAQALANGHGFTQTATPATMGKKVGSFVAFTNYGTTLATDTTDVGMQAVKYTDANIVVAVHEEKDDSTSGVPLRTKGDALPVTYNDVEAQVYDSVKAAKTAAQPVLTTGIITFPNVATGKTYTIRARSNNATIDVLNDTTATTVLDGSDQADTVNTLGSSGGKSTFAFKYNDANIGGFIKAADGTAANGVHIKLMANAMNIQPNRAKDTTLTVAGGAYFVPGLREGPYDVMALDSVTATGDSIWAFLGTKSATTDPSGPASAKVVNFTATRMDTKIRGIVANDRDSDYNTLDPEEALSGVTVNLYRDNSGATTKIDTLIATTTTDGNGAYTFSKLREANYIVQAVSPSSAQVLRALASNGTVTDTLVVHTAAALGVACAGAPCTLNQDNTRTVGNTDPKSQSDELPRWSYLTGTAATDGGHLSLTASPNRVNIGAPTLATTITPTHFVHLFKTGIVTGKVIIAAGTGVAGVRVTVTRCQTVGTAPSPPAGGACTTKHGTPSPWVVNIDTDANGLFTASGLLEGVYEIDVAPATAGYTNNLGPDGVALTGDETMLATLQGNNDVETVANYIIS